jgi:flagellar basal body-associated protein FliL
VPFKNLHGECNFGTRLRHSNEGMATQDNTTPQTGGIKKFLIASIGVSILGLLVGFSIASLLLASEVNQPIDEEKDASEVQAKEGGHSSEKAEEGAATESEAVVRGPYSIVQLQPIVTNLADSTEVWVGLEGSMLFDTKSETNSEVLAHRLSQHVMAYLRTLKLSDMQGTGAISAISQDLNEIAATVGEGQVDGVLISGLVFE